jgi:phosphatidylglycerol:prolipoprotein diacylglycerol transferase
MTSEQKSIFKTILTALAIGCVGFFGLSWLLGPFFSGNIVLPQNLRIGGIRIQFYGIIIAVGALVGYWLALKRREKSGIKSDDAELIIFLVIVAGFVGARLYHVVSELHLYTDNLLKIFAVWNGGLSIYGAAIGGVIALYVYSKYYKDYSLLQLLDWLIPSMVVGQIIGRFGNFANYEIYGTPTGLPWKMFVPIQFRTPPFELNQFFHPLFLYEAVGSAIILVLLLRLKLKTGYLFLIWLLLYNVLRFLLEQLRVGSVIYGGIRVNAIVSLVLVVVAIAIIYRVKKQPNYDS